MFQILANWLIYSGMELSMIAGDAVVSTMKQKLLNHMHLNDEEDFQNPESLGRILVNIFKTTRNLVKFLNIDDISLSVDMMIYFLQKKLVLYNVLEMVFTAIDGIGRYANTVERLQNAMVLVMHTVSEM